MATTVSNATVDTAAAAVGAPYGPLTRVTDMDTLPTPNSQHKIAFTSNVGSTPVEMTYEELLITGVRDRILEQAHNWTDVVRKFGAAIDGLDTLWTAMSAPHTFADYQSLQNYVRQNFPWVRGIEG